MTYSLVDRNAIVYAAERWLNTPFHHAARLRGVGVDCINLLCAVYEEAGFIDHIELPVYPPDWMMHRDEEKMLAGVMRHTAREIRVPLAGDVAVFKFGRCYSHGAIVTCLPEVIHAMAALGAVVRGDATKHPLLDGKTGAPRAVKFYSVL